MLLARPVGGEVRRGWIRDLNNMTNTQTFLSYMDDYNTKTTFLQASSNCVCKWMFVPSNSAYEVTLSYWWVKRLFCVSGILRGDCHWVLLKKWSSARFLRSPGLVFPAFWSLIRNWKCRYREIFQKPAWIYCIVISIHVSTLLIE